MSALEPAFDARVMEIAEAGRASIQWDRGGDTIAGPANLERISSVLTEAALVGRLSWREVYSTVTIVERFAYLENRRVWTTYLALGGAPGRVR